ncbi:hypothetical protein IV498_12415 [Paenarthrobacter sp. Z7-10]|nr:hypothetical protein [Paenarthrobacter sp. Z7-10]
MGGGRRRRQRRGIAAASLAAVLSVAAGGGVAFAYWTTGGTGSGSAVNSDLQAVTVEAYAAAGPAQSALFPGGSSDVTMRVTNENSYPVHIYSVTAAGPVTADGGHSACTNNGVTFGPVSSPLSPATSIAAHTTSVVVLPAAAKMDTSSQSACQGASFSLPVTVEVRK